MTRGDAKPDLSVIVPSVNGFAILSETLETLRTGGAADGLVFEVLVLDRCGEDLRAAVRCRFPEVTVTAASPGTTIPELRAMGFRQARADAVAVIEDHTLVERGWGRQMLDALAAGADVVGGSVYNAAVNSTVDWAAFLCEYSHLLPPLPAGPVEALTGNNVVYRRALLDRYAEIIDAGRWEDYLHAAMRRDGVRLVCRPEIRILHKRHYRVREYVSERYLYARAYAGLRRGDMPPARRALFAAGALALPPVLFWRVVRRVMAARGHGRALLRSLPLLGLFVCAWSVGEVVGYSIGPGDALARVK
jgi:glycosyltransferase involved in cell wall biosynthesis